MAKLNFKKIATNVIGTSLGAIAVEETFEKVPIKDTKIKAGAFMLLGAVLGELMPKSAEAQAFGAGVIANAASKMYQSVKLGAPLEKVSGIDNTIIAGDEHVIAGIDEEGNAVYGVTDEEGEVIGYINEFGEEVDVMSGTDDDNDDDDSMSGFEDEDEE